MLSERTNSPNSITPLRLRSNSPNNCRRDNEKLVLLQSLENNGNSGGVINQCEMADSEGL